MATLSTEQAVIIIAVLVGIWVGYTQGVATGTLLWTAIGTVIGVIVGALVGWSLYNNSEEPAWVIIAGLVGAYIEYGSGSILNIGGGLVVGGIVGFVLYSFYEHSQQGK